MAKALVLNQRNSIDNLRVDTSMNIVSIAESVSFGESPSKQKQKMWKAAAGHTVEDNGNGAGDDDWETDPDFVNDVNEQEQRWGGKTGRTAGAIE